MFEPSLRMATSRSILRTCRRSLRHSSVPDSPTHTAVAARYPQLFSPFHNSPELWAPPPSLRAGTQFPFAHSATGHPHFAAEGFVQRRASPPDPAASTHRPLPSRTSSAMKRSELPVLFTVGRASSAVSPLLPVIFRRRRRGGHGRGLGSSGANCPALAPAAERR